MKKDMITRTFSISKEITGNKVNEICGVFRLTKSTLYRIAIYNGIQRIMNGYRPTRDHHHKVKEKIKMSMPKEGWELFDQALEVVKYKCEEPIPAGELVNIFIEMEIKEFSQYMEFEREHYNEPSKPITFSVDVPESIYNLISDIKYVSGIADTQVWKYFTYRGLLDEYMFKDVESIYNDVDILKLIDTLNLPRAKTMILIRNLIESGRISWND